MSFEWSLDGIATSHFLFSEHIDKYIFDIGKDKFEHFPFFTRNIRDVGCQKIDCRLWDLEKCIALLNC